MAKNAAEVNAKIIWDKIPQCQDEAVHCIRGGKAGLAWYCKKQSADKTCPSVSLNADQQLRLSSLTSGRVCVYTPSKNDKCSMGENDATAFFGTKASVGADVHKQIVKDHPRFKANEAAYDDELNFAAAHDAYSAYSGYDTYSGYDAYADSVGSKMAKDGKQVYAELMAARVPSCNDESLLCERGEWRCKKQGTCPSSVTLKSGTLKLTKNEALCGYRSKEDDECWIGVKDATAFFGKKASAVDDLYNQVINKNKGRFGANEAAYDDALNSAAAYDVYNEYDAYSGYDAYGGYDAYADSVDSAASSMIYDNGYRDNSLNDASAFQMGVGIVLVCFFITVISILCSLVGCCIGGIAAYVVAIFGRDADARARKEELDVEEQADMNSV